MPDPTTPGWHPDPQHPGMVRWWNGLGWSDARRSLDAARDRFTAIRPAAEDDARRGLAAVGTRARTQAPGRVARAGTRAVTASNGFAAAAIALGILGMVVGAYGLLPLAGLVVALTGLARSRRLARDGVPRTGLGASLGGLILSVLGLLRWIPVAVALVRQLDVRFS